MRPLVRACAVMLLLACGGSGPRAIAYDVDACDYCRMQISDRRFGAEVITNRGKVLEFDSIECLASYYRATATGDAFGEAPRVWVSDFRHPGTLIPVADARFLRVAGSVSPMGHGWLAVATDSDAADVSGERDGKVRTWAQVLADTSVAQTAVAEPPR